MQSIVVLVSCVVSETRFWFWFWGVTVVWCGSASFVVTMEQRTGFHFATSGFNQDHIRGQRLRLKKWWRLSSCLKPNWPNSKSQIDQIQTKNCKKPRFV